MVLVEFGVEPRLPRKRPRLTPEEKVARLDAELVMSPLSKKKG